MQYTTESKACQAPSLATLADSDKIFLLPTDVAPLLDCDPHLIRLMARDEKHRQQLGFPVVVIGTRTKIPRIPFLRYMGWKGAIKGEQEDYTT